MAGSLAPAESGATLRLVMIAIIAVMSLCIAGATSAQAVGRAGDASVDAGFART
jgi:hypothetical protein